MPAWRNWIGWFSIVSRSSRRRVLRPMTRSSFTPPVFTAPQFLRARSFAFTLISLRIVSTCLRSIQSEEYPPEALCTNSGGLGAAHWHRSFLHCR